MTKTIYVISKWMLILALALTLSAWLSAYSQQKPNKNPTPKKGEEDPPKCNCYIPKTKEYGVIKGDNCTVVKCQKKAPEK